MMVYRRLFSFAGLLALVAVSAGCSGSEAGPDASLRPDGSPVVTWADAGEPDTGAPDAGRGDAGKPQLILKSVVPSRGQLTGNTRVTLEGGGFYQGFAEGATDAKKQTRVRFGDNQVAQIDIIDDSTMEVVTPPNPAGQTDVVVENPNGVATCTYCFGYFLDLSLTSIAPDRGPLEGGTEIELKGDAFIDSLTVLVGGKASPKVTLVDAQTARAVVPPGAVPGPVDVRVFNKNGVGEIRRGFTYQQLPKLNRVEPPYGPIAGGGTVRLEGAGLALALRVLFGAQEAAFHVVDDSAIEVTVPAVAAPGPVDVSVEAPLGTALRPRGYIYFDDAATGLSLTGVWPTHGPPAGGQSLTVVGSRFDAATIFEIGGAVATLVGSPTANVATVTVPATAVANHWVEVRASAGADEATLAQGYHYNLALDSVTPTSGAAHGGEIVAVAGAGLSADLRVFFGALEASQVSATSSSALSVTTPPGSGAVDVRVRDPLDEENEAVLPSGFRYAESVFLGRVSPVTGSIAGGTYVTVLGTGFAPGTSVLFGDAPLKDLRVVDAYTIIGHTPPGASGAVDVKVKRAAEEDVSVSAFTYFDPTNGGGGSSGGPLDGTLNVTVLDASYLRYGQGVLGATVMLGNDPTTPFQGKTDRKGQITFSDPALAKAQTVTAYKEGYQPITVVRQESQNLTLFLSPTTSEPGSPEATPPGSGGGPTIISGHVQGFKPPRALESHETTWAEVWVVPQSVYSTPPFGSKVSPEARDARGERWKVTSDGGSYSVFASAGLRAVYAVYGIYDRRSEVFTPALLGVRRAINADPNRPAFDQDIVLDVHLDQTVPVYLDRPVIDPALLRMAHTTLYAWLELGAEGIIPLGSAETRAATFQMPNLPQVDGDNLLFLARAVGGAVGSESFTFRKQLGDLSVGLTVGPMLGLTQWAEPVSERGFEGRISWSTASAVDADVARLTLSRMSGYTGWTSIWTVILPGSERSVTLPQNLFDDLRATGYPDDQLVVSLVCSRAARFDYAHWSYTSLATDTWTSWTQAGGTFALFAPAGPDAGLDLPDGAIETPDAGLDVPDGAIETPDAESVPVDAGPELPDAGLETPDVGSVEPDAGS
ncbi:MAG: IPT/TIG domain-containing protein [Deltaproteobacteria bacterium]|nr:IPT/TIG domain-containing protein [Deltaproteobacteria bacterium]